MAAGTDETQRDVCVLAKNRCGVWEKTDRRAGVRRRRIAQRKALLSCYALHSRGHVPQRVSTHYTGQRVLREEVLGEAGGQGRGSEGDGVGGGDCV